MADFAGGLSGPTRYRIETWNKTIQPLGIEGRPLGRLIVAKYKRHADSLMS
ncbi:MULTISPECIES: hypothetical protein [Nitrosospira]|uniref:hypothetical protein n=1 Tax=Nitrosospira TaxID=35798 RepID=UPI0015A01E68|nr:MULTISPECIES: hypothetical protein [Nitrosospira]